MDVSGFLVHIFPWCPSFYPDQILQNKCPMWISFPDLLPMVKGSFSHHRRSHWAKFCTSLLWGKMRVEGRGEHASSGTTANDTLDELQLSTPDGINFIVAVKFVLFPYSCYKYKETSHFACHETSPLREK